MSIHRLYEVDPLECSQCGGALKTISYIEACQHDVFESTRLTGVFDIYDALDAFKR
jgi:hypothetical protein